MYFFCPQVVNTSWAMLALLAGTEGCDESMAGAAPVLARAAAFLMSMQEPTGDWPQQLISGIFGHTFLILNRWARDEWL